MAAVPTMIDASSILAQARKTYAWYYAKADPFGAAALDGLVLARAAYTLGMSTLKHIGAPTDDTGLDRATDRVERRFMEHRELVRSTDAFQSLASKEQRQIERELFEVEVP